MKGEEALCSLREEVSKDFTYKPRKLNRLQRHWVHGIRYSKEIQLNERGARCRQCKK